MRARPMVELAGLGKTPWVDRSLAPVWGELAEQMGQDMLPLPLPTASGRRRRKLVVDEFGCGAFGCVMPTGRPDVVLKITGDLSEAWFASAAMALAANIAPHASADGWPVGIVRYYAVRPMNATHRGRPLFLLWRQEAHDVGYLANSYGSFFGPLGKDLGEFKWHAGRIFQRVRRSKNPRGAAASIDQMLRTHGGQIYEVVAERTEYRARGEAIDTSSLREFIRLSKASPAVDVRACEVIAEHMQNSYGQVELGTALGYYLDKGLVLADVHLNNVGRATHPDYGEPVPTITDPGLAVPINPAWFDYQIGGPLPELTRPS